MPAKLPYGKLPLPIAEQVALLQARGMAIADVQKATHYLTFIGYYRLSGYTRFFVDHSIPDNERFVAGTTFQHALDLYVFDRKIRTLLLDALERIEIAVKSAVCNTGALQGQSGAFWMKNAANFDHGQHQIIMEMVRERTDQTKPGYHQFIPHFFLKYLEDVPPTWMVMETLSFSDASKVYKRMKGNLRLPIAALFSVQHDILESWLHALAFGRNMCAHHARIWNQRFTIKPKIPKQYGGTWPTASQDRLYVLCGIIHHMMDVIADGSEWHLRLRDLVRTRPHGITLTLMGFPDDWEAHKFWKF